MALKPFNSVAGYSVGEVPSANIILANGDITASNATFSGNLLISNANASFGILTDNLYYSNGVPWDLQEAAGANFQIQFNDSNNFGASANFAFNPATNLLTVAGNINVANADLGNLVVANFVSISSNITTNNLTVNLALTGNTANFTGNVTAGNVNTTSVVASILTSNVTTGTAPLTVSSTTKVANLNVDLLDGYDSAISATANTVVIRNEEGNISGNYFIGNGAFLTGIDATSIQNGNSNVAIAANGNVVITATSNSVITISGAGANVIGYVTANGEGSFGGVKSNTVTAQGGNLTLFASTGNNYVELRPTGTGQVDVGNFRIENLADPVNSQDAATKLYVDNVAEGLHIHASVIAVTNDTLANISAGAITYDNGASGVGATLSTTGTYILIDTVNIATVGTRILVKDEINTAHNGIYVYTNSTTLTRADDYDTAAEIQGGDFVFSTSGAEYNSTGWVQIDTVTTVGTDPIVWDQFSGAGTFTAGLGLTLTGTVFSVNTDGITTEIAGGNVAVKANAVFTTPNIGAATGTSLAVTGNIVAANITANTLITTTDLNASGNIIAANISANANLTVNNATVNLALTGNTANFIGNVSANNLSLTNNVNANIANIVTRIDLGNTDIVWGTATTTSISANQTIATFAVTGITGVEFLVKGIDSTGSKYSVTTVQAVTDGTSADFTTFATVNLGGLTGILSVNVVGSNVALQVSPSSSNSTVWTTQFRTI